KQLQKWLFRQNAMSTVEQYYDPPDKSEGDKKLYRALSLTNGLRAMLISDPKTEELQQKGSDASLNSSLEQLQGKQAACAVLVTVGSFSEPRQCQGLAHFLEHMIFMGSEKYPAENAFDAFVSKCGGSSNAHTENECTCFYFEVEEAHLDKCMDLFMNLIKAPLMRLNAMERERSALQSEFEQVHMNDGARKEQVFGSLASEDFPHGTFGWGNLKSLKEVDDATLHKELHTFFRKHYGSNRMIVSIQSEQPLDKLEELLLRHCGDISRCQENTLDLSMYGYQAAFQEKFFTNVLLVQPVEDVCKLELTWVLPPMKKFYRSKPDTFLEQLIGYEGVGSLCSYLRRRLWCMSVSAGVGGGTNSIYSLFTISIYLTDDGFEHIDEVLGATFAWIKLLNNSSELPAHYEELQQIAKNSFRFPVELPSIDNVQNIVEDFSYLPSKDVLTGSSLYFQYNEADLQIVKQHMNAFNFNIMISSHIPYENHEYDQEEQWFGTQYTTIPMPSKWETLWQKPPVLKELALPKPNPFITTDFTLHWKQAGQPHISRSPKSLMKNDLGELWFRQDNIFQLPEGYINLYFITPLVQQSVENYMLGVLFTYLVEFSIAEQLYPALEAGLTYGLYSGEKGLILRVSGFNQKLPLLVEIILKVMQTINLDPAQVESFKELKKRQIFNTLINGNALNHDLFYSILENKHFSLIQEYEAIDGITVDNLKQFMDNFPKKMYVQGLIQGNFTADQAKELMESVISMYKSEKIESLSSLDNSLLQVPLGSHFLRARALNENDTNTIVSNYYQVGPCDTKLDCLMGLVMMITGEPFFNQLRTQEQLGYSLGIFPWLGYGIMAFVITINTQENKHTADFVEKRIEQFRAGMSELVSKLSNDEFAAVRESLVGNKRLRDHSLDEEVGRNWIEIVTREYFFNRVEMQIQMINSLSKEHLLDFLRDYEKNNFRKLSVQVVGRGNRVGDSQASSLSGMLDVGHHSLSEVISGKINIKFLGTDDDPSNIKDISAFKQNLYVYPLIFTNPMLSEKT
ncbi:hypothetical protein KR059_011100, partial [Drosophila kikkawai]